MSNIPKKNGNLLQCHLAFLQKTKERRRWSVASIPSSGYGTITPASSNSQCSLNTDDHYYCNCLQYGTHYHSNHSQQNSQSNQSAISNSINLSSKLLNNSLTSTLAQHLSSNDSNPSLDEDGKLLLPVNFRPRSRSLSSPVRSPAIDLKSSISKSKENLKNEIIKSSMFPSTLTFRRRSRSLSSPVRSPGVENRFSQMSNVYKERFPNAINQMNEKLKKFIEDNPELISEIASDAVTRFVHHQVIEMAKDCLQKSKDELLTSFYFHEISESLEKLLNECRGKSPSATLHLKILIKKLLLIISRPARLLECLEFNPEEFYRFLEVAEGQAKTVQGIKKDLPKYIINKLGISKDPLTEFKELDEKLHHTSINENSIKLNKDSNNLIKLPSENDYETIKLISNGAYGAVYLVKHKETNQRFAMKKISKQNLILRNQIEQAFAERDIMCFTDNPFVVSLFCSFETKLHLCMVMEYVEGGDCATLLKNMGPFPVDLAKFYFAETVLAVEYLHSYGIMHRDLKPDNLLITSLGHIKLTDFGLSKIGLMNLATNLYEGFLDRDTKKFNDKQVYGTPEYIAPEVILRQGYGKPVDWWAMGIILYEFLIGCVPFFGETAEELFSHVINDEIEWPNDEDWPLPEEAKYIITQFLMPNPKDRLGTSGTAEIKEHPFFNGINWNALLRQKAEFVPQLMGEYDTSYFDTRLERYNHELDDSEGLADSDESPLFSSFSSCSPRYHKVYSKIEKELLQEKPTKSSSTSSIVDETNKCNYQLSKMNLSTPEYSSTANLLRALSLNENSNESIENLNESNNSNNLNNSDSAIIFKENLNDMNITFNSDTSDNYSPLVQRRRRKIESKDMPTMYIEKSNKNESSFENRSLTPSIKEIPPDDSIEENKNDNNEENSFILDENKLNIASNKSRSVIKSASVSGLSQLLPGLENQTFNKSEQRKSLNYDNEYNISFSSLLSQSGSLRLNSKKKAMSKNFKDNYPSKQSFRKNIYLYKNSIRRSIASPYESSTSSRDTSPSRDLKNRKEDINESQKSTSNDLSLSGSKSNLSYQLKAPIILRKSNLGFGFSFKAIRVYYGDSDVYTVHHLVYNVEPNSPASKVGLKQGDLITHINSEPLQGLLHYQVLQLVLSGGDKIQVKTTPLEYTSIKSGGRRRNPNSVRLAKRCGNSISNRYYHKKSSNCLTSNNDISLLNSSVFKRTDSDKRYKNPNLIRRLSSKRSSAEINKLLSTSTNNFLPSDNNNINKQKDTNLENMTLSKSFQYLGTEDKNEHLNNKNFNLHSKKLYSHLFYQHSISDSSQSSSPNTSVPNSPANLTLQTSKQPISNCFNRPSTLHGLKHKLVQTFRSPRRKSCGHIPLSPLARNSSPSSCASTFTPNSNLLSVSPTRSPSPLASSNNGQTNNNYRHHQHMHYLNLNSQLHCHNQILKQRCNINNSFNETLSSQNHHSPCIKVKCSSNCFLSVGNNVSNQCQKLNNCLSDKEKNFTLNSNYSQKSSTNKNPSSSHYLSRPKSAEPETVPAQYLSCKCSKPENLETCYLNKKLCNCKLKLKRNSNCFVLQATINDNISSTPCSNINNKKIINPQNLKNSTFEEKEIEKENDNEKKNDKNNESDKNFEENQVKYSSTVLEFKDSIEQNKNELKKEKINLGKNVEIEKDIGRNNNNISSSFTSSNLDEKKKTLKNIETNLDENLSSSNKTISSSHTSESTFSKVKKSLGSPISIRKTLFKQNIDKRNKNNRTSKDV